MGRRQSTREFKIEAVRMGREQGVSVAQASRGLDVHENVLRKWITQFDDDPRQAFPSQGGRADDGDGKVKRTIAQTVQQPLERSLAQLNRDLGSGRDLPQKIDAAAVQGLAGQSAQARR